VSDVTVIDAGMGNLASISNALRTVGGNVNVTSTPSDILKANRLVLPGVGAFGRCISELRKRRLRVPLEARIKAGVPVLGICIGFQALFKSSDELGFHRGLGHVPGKVKRFDDDELIVPHMGWNIMHPKRDHPLFSDLPETSYVYFVHSFRPVTVPDKYVLATTDYGDDFVSAVATENLVGVQFHPEKSGPTGLRMLTNFLGWDPS